ncbi:uncharacterized protein B0P05DRAFT_41551 [Gilbertella persicaria]|uniref:uncharacterized protein n=1 Tax=Gilbertella persicaria TaxID=101096 RepID=UPI00222080E7|nr:uncharacterized protein B0P05DRAFT_41551 [Gilbertella persicaria]KAI8084027.1 hypothetical protein B0P05DRAFT_41551 [Gilbertella persicaria]
MERADTDVHQQNQSISFELQEHDITEIGEEDSSDESMIDIENDLINEIHEIIDDNSEVANSQQKAVGEIKEVEAESEEESSAPKEQLVCTDTRSMDDDFISLKRFREDGTEEEHKERNKRMHGSGILFTREAYQKYTTTEEVDKEYKHDWQAILQLEEWIEQEGIVPRQPKQVEPEPAKVPEASVLPLPVVEAEPAPDNVPHIGTSPLDALMMKEKKGRVTRQQKQRMNDLKIAAMAAGNNGQSPSSSSSERYSRYTKEEHIKFIAINEKKKKVTSFSAIIHILRLSFSLGY